MDMTEENLESLRTDSSIDDGRKKPTATPITAKPSQVYEVQIAGIPMRLKSSHDEATVHELVATVDRKVQEALPLTKTGSMQNAAVLASLNLAEEQLLLKKRALQEIDRLEAELSSVLKDLKGFRSPD